MRPGIAALIVFAASILVYAIFRNLLNQEVAAVALATIPGLLSIWLQSDRSSSTEHAKLSLRTPGNFTNWHIAALFAFATLAIWIVGLMALDAFNLALADLIQKGFISGSEEGFNHLQIYFIGLSFIFMWLPLLCVFSAYMGPRSQTGAFWPYCLGLISTLFAFVCVRFLFVENAFNETLAVVRYAVTLDVGAVQGGRFLALAAILSTFVVMLLMISGIPWMVARIRRYFAFR